MKCALCGRRMDTDEPKSDMAFPHDCFSGDDEQGVLLADGLEEAFLGIAQQYTLRFAVYDRAKCIEILARDMTSENAEEYFQFNTQGAYLGEQTPAFLERAESEDAR